MEKAAEPGGTSHSAIFHESRDAASLQRQSLIEGARELSGAPLDHTHAVSLYGSDRREGPHLPQPLADAEWKIEPGWIGAIDDIQVMVPGNHEHARGENRMPCQDVQEFPPFGRETGIGQIAADEQDVERVSAMDGLEARHEALHSIVAARPTTSALDAKTVSFTDNVEV